jgi:lipopolysaccharide export system protein LptA
MNYTRKIFFSLLVWLLMSKATLYAQKAAAPIVQDSTRKVYILSNTRDLTFKTIDDSTKLTIVTGNVKLRQGTALFYCDSCVINQRTNIFEAWGRVHINDSDTAHVYSNHLRYLGNTKFAYLDGNVRMTDGHATLTTPDLDYDLQTNIGTYKNGGKVVNKKTVLTSKEGFYYADLKDVYFKKNVQLRDPAYDIDTDSLLYNTENRTTRFISQTTIKDSSGRLIRTREGFYNQQTGKAEFGSRPEIIDGKTFITANRIAFDDSTSIYQAEGNAVIRDTAEGTTIIGGLIYQNKKTEAILATRKPLMIIKQENDSIYITADTLFSARLSDKFKGRTLLMTETAGGKKILTFSEADSLTESVPDTSLNKKPNLPSSLPDSLALEKSNEKITPISGNDSISNTIADTSLARQSGNITATGDSLSAGKPKEKKIMTLPGKDSLSTIANNTASFKRTTGKTVNRNIQAKDTTKKSNIVVFTEKDSTNRYFEAYSHVRIFSDSLQSVCDSVFYSFKDSVFRLYKDPVVWANNSQVTGDTILLFTKNKKADKVEAFENSFLVNRLENEVYNQIKSDRMDGWFVDGNIDSVRAKAFAECIYYIQDEDSAYTGVNQSQSDIIDIYFENKELEKVVFRSSVTGTLWPISQKSPAEMQLPGFRWLEERRPKTKFEMFE